MCGIAGILNLTEPRPIAMQTIDAMIGQLRHRGPDEFGVYRDNWAGLANARLSIVDLAGGQQPISNEDATLWIVYNGEVFNDPDLRPALLAQGHQFATHCDTETIVHLYEQHGPDFLHRLNGQFAIALWDAAQRTLLLARDRLGVRPLFYTVQHGQLLFGSEVKALLANPAVETRIDPRMLPQVFTYWSVQSPNTIFEGIYELPPGCYMLVKDGQITIQRYWSPDFTQASPERSDDEYLETFEQLLIDAAQIRLRADVPVGAYLSGGLDSSVTAAIIQKYTNVQLDTFSIAFAHPQYNESEFQQRMAAHLGTHHHVVQCESADIGAIFPDVIRHTETPILRTSPAPMFLLSKLVNDFHYKVVLTGEGADEFLGGYDIFKEAAIRRFMADEPDSLLRPQLLKKLYQDIPRMAKNEAYLSGFFGRDLAQAASPYFSHQIRWNNTARTLRFMAAPSAPPAPEQVVPLPAQFDAWSSLAQAQYLEIVTFLSPYLLSSQGDRVGMAHSVEGRFPFLDYRVVEFANRLPAHLKLRGLNEKYILRKLGKKLLPPEIWQRPKRPYRAPIQHSFFPDGKALAYVAELFSDASVRDGGFFNPIAVGKLAAKAANPAPLSEMEEMALVGILSTQLLNHDFLGDRHPARHPIQPYNVKRIDRIVN